MGINNVRENRRKADQILRSDQAYSQASPTLIDKAKNFIGGMNQKYVQPMMTKYRDFYSNPNDPYSLFSDKGLDELKFIGNKLATGAEFAGDLLQLPFEVAGQAMGLNVGSGQGAGDLPMAAQINDYFGVNPFYDPLKEEEFFNKMYELNPTNQYDAFGGTVPITDIYSDRNFINYLKTQKGLDFTSYPMSELDQGEMYNELIYPQVAPMYEQQAFEDFLTENKLPYNQESLTTYKNMITDRENQIYVDEILNPYGLYQAQLNIPGFLDEFNISEDFLYDPSVPADLGIYNDLMGDQYEPFEYETASGKNLFNDPMMSIMGDIPGYIIPGKLTSVGLKKLPRPVRAVTNQLYPGATNTGIGFPIRLKNRPNVKGFNIPYSALVRSPVQFGLLGEYAESLDD
tara:strand:+ start:321 stop:1523 length:1203 start_codon:yes stop_codon:yes gene_type:complete